MYEYHLAVSLYANSRLIRQVLCFKAATGVVLVSYELVGAIMVGTHETVSFEKFPEVAGKLAALAREWRADESSPTRLLTS